MRGLEVLAGNPQAKHRLSAGRGLSHAYILSAAAGIHPDVITVGEEGKDINVAMVRALRSDAYIRPNEAPRKVYLLPNAHTMNQSAQNALLKLLEEGPPYAAFLLLAENAGAILPTVRSRCETLTLAPVTEAEARTVLTAHFPARPAPVPAAAGQLVKLLRDGPERAALEFCVGLEKWERDDLCALLEEGVEVLRSGMGRYRDTRRALALAGRLEEIRRSLDFHVGAGHVAGWLCAGSF